MSVNATAAATTSNLSSVILQQLLSGSNAQATSEMPASLLEEVLSASGSSTQAAASQTAVPASVAQALGELLSGSDPSASSANLSQLQSYFKQNPSALTGLLGSLQAGAGTYSADGTVSSSSSLLAALGIGSGAGSATSTSLLSQLLSGQDQDPLLASLGGSSSTSSGSALSLLG
jgi:hypothetical protein